MSKRLKKTRPKTASHNKPRTTSNADSAPATNVELSVTQSLELVRQEIRNYLGKEQNTPTANILKLVTSVYENNIAFRDFEIKRMFQFLEDSKDGSSRPSAQNDHGKLSTHLYIIVDLADTEQDMNSSKVDDSKRSKKIKVLKYSNIEYADDKKSDKNRSKVPKNKIQKQYQTSAGFSLENNGRTVKPKPGTDFKYSHPPQKIKDFVDDEMDIPYNNNFDSPEKK